MFPPVYCTQHMAIHKVYTWHIPSAFHHHQPCVLIKNIWLLFYKHIKRLLDIYVLVPALLKFQLTLCLQSQSHHTSLKA